METLKEHIIEREKGYLYWIDKDGNIVRDKKYTLSRILLDPYLFIFIMVLLASGFYYHDVGPAFDTLHHLNQTCATYCLYNHPSQASLNLNNLSFKNGKN